MKQRFNQFPKVRRLIFLTVGCLMDALAVNLFLADNDIAAGGLAGIATVLVRFIPIKMSVLLILMNIPVLVTALIIKGYRFVSSSIVGILIYTALVEVTSYFPVLTTNKLLAAACGGLCYGMGSAFVTLGEGSIGGTELIVRILRTVFPKIGMDGFFMLVDGSIVVFAMIMYHDVEAGLYAILTILLCSRLVNRFTNRIVWGQGHGDLCVIITNKPAHEVADRIMRELGIAVTSLAGEGMYSDSRQSVLLAAVVESDTYRLRELLADADESSFVIVLPVNEVMGGKLV